MTETEEKNPGLDKKTWVSEFLEETGEDAIILDGFDEAILGVGRRWDERPLVVYDREKMIEVLERGMTREEAKDYLSFNVEGAWLGESTPMILERPPEEG